MNTASSTTSRRRRRSLIGDALRPAGRRQWRVAAARFASDCVVVGDVPSDEATGVNVGRATWTGGNVGVDWPEVTRRARNDASGMRSRGAMGNEFTEQTACPTVRSGRCRRSLELPSITEKSHRDSNGVGWHRGSEQIGQTVIQNGQRLWCRFTGLGDRTSGKTSSWPDVSGGVHKVTRRCRTIRERRVGWCLTTSHCLPTAGRRGSCRPAAGGM